MQSAHYRPLTTVFGLLLDDEKCVSVAQVCDACADRYKDRSQPEPDTCLRLTIHKRLEPGLLAQCDAQHWA